MADGVVKITSIEGARQFAQSDLDEARIEEATQAVRDEGDAAWAWIEPLAGLLFPRVEAEIKRRLAADGA